MKLADLKTQLIEEIERIAGNEESLQKAIDYLQGLRDSENTIGKVGSMVGKQIRHNLSLIVPVVCDDMYEYVAPDGVVKSLNEYIYDILDDLIDEESKKEIRKEIISNFYYGITFYEREQNDNVNSCLYSNIKQAVENGNIRLKGHVREFLIKGNFPLIITTFGFEVLEQFYPKDNRYSEWYCPYGRNDIPLKVRDGIHTIYHIFGGTSDSSWVYNEPTLLRFMHSLHDGDYMAKNLSHYLRNIGASPKRLLVLGSTLPDWIFRFFVYPMYEEGLQQMAGYWLSLNDVEKGLGLFLQRNSFSGRANLKNSNRLEEIMQEATPEISSIDSQQHQSHKIFVSYKREPEDTPESKKISKILKRVIDILRKQDFTWYDIDQVSDGGNPYWANIKRAVQECDYFVPLVTKKYMKAYEEAADIESYAKKEILDALEQNANDDSTISSLSPVVREAYYALAYKKKCVPIIIKDDDNLSGGKVESVAKNHEDNQNLPKSIFLERTLLLHDDKNPSFFKFSKEE